MLVVIATGTHTPSEIDEQTFIDWFVDSVKSRIRKDANGHPVNEPVILFEGGAEGVDSIAQSLVDHAPFTDSATIHALWDQHGKRAGMRRNALMLRMGRALADSVPNGRVVVLGCPGPKSIGTWGMLELAAKQGVSVDLIDHWADASRVLKFRQLLRSQEK